MQRYEILPYNFGFRKLQSLPVVIWNPLRNLFFTKKDISIPNQNSNDTCEDEPYKTLNDFMDTYIPILLNTMKDLSDSDQKYNNSFTLNFVENIYSQYDFRNAKGDKETGQSFCEQISVSFTENVGFSCDVYVGQCGSSDEQCDFVNKVQNELIKNTNELWSKLKNIKGYGQAEFTVYQNDAYRKGDLLLGNNKEYVVEKSKGEEAVCKPAS